jgi:hypothetical protein
MHSKPTASRCPPTSRPAARRPQREDRPLSSLHRGDGAHLRRDARGVFAGAPGAGTQPNRREDTACRDDPDDCTPATASFDVDIVDHLPTADVDVEAEAGIGLHNDTTRQVARLDVGGRHHDDLVAPGGHDDISVAPH